MPHLLSRSWALVVPCLCFKFHIFDKPILEKYVSQVERGSHLLQSCLCATRNGLPLVAKEMHPFFESLAVTDALGLQAFFMDIHHDTSLKNILEDDSISSASIAHICSCLGKGAGLWLVVKPYICSFHIAHFTFTFTLHIHLGLIQPLASNLFMYECGHGLDASSTHLAHYPFGGQRIATHDAIRDIMYAFV